MSWFDFLKEIPLAGVLKEQNTALKEKQAELQAKIVALEQENAALKDQMQVCKQRNQDLEDQAHRKTLSILPRRIRSEYHWSLSKHQAEPVMNVSARFIVTNITDEVIRPSGARLDKGNGQGWVMVEDPQTHSYGWFDILPHDKTFADVSILISPPFAQEGESFTADVAIYDEFNNEHWIRGIEFLYGN